MNVPVEIDTRDDRLAFDLFGATTLAVGTSVTVPGGAVLAFRGLARRVPPGEPFTVRFELQLAPGASAAEVSAWLCAQLRGRALGLRVLGAPVDVLAAPVARALTPDAGPPAP